MDVKNFLLSLGIISGFSLFFTLLFLKPSRKWRKKLIVDSKVEYRSFLINLSNLLLATLLFNHIFINQSNYDPVLVAIGLVSLVFTNLGKGKDND